MIPYPAGKRPHDYCSAAVYRTRSLFHINGKYAFLPSRSIPCKILLLSLEKTEDIEDICATTHRTDLTINGWPDCRSVCWKTDHEPLPQFLKESQNDLCPNHLQGLSYKASNSNHYNMLSLSKGFKTNKGVREEQFCLLICVFSLIRLGVV